MGFLKFSSDGGLVLSGKLKEEKDEEERSVVLSRVQVSKNNPAVAQLRIRIGKKLAPNSSIMNSLKDQCEKYLKYKQSSSQTSIEFKNGDEGFTSEIIVEARSSWDMYSYLKELMMNIRNNSDFPIVVRGSWDQ